jgi:ABC-2 type transport system permease protein
MDETLIRLVLQLAWLCVIDALFLGVLALAFLVPLATFRQAAFAVLKRNFVGYFSNPTGYVFLCLFVALTSYGAFWPHEFFTNNLANLDQLNKVIPSVLLLFIPAITMSIWADERRQGTDELLLTLPATDFDIVAGKYFAAVSIFTVSLLFSQLASSAVLNALTLGEMDSGLLFTTYMGYWFIGLAMLAIGMVASFLTTNLTVGFILGILFNAPLVLAKTADIIVARADWASLISRWSAASQFDDFGRGVLSFASCAYFLMVAVAGVYLSMVLIGSRHWFGGRDGQSMLGHYVVRALSLGAIIIGTTLFLSNHDYGRFDFTAGKVSSLSPQTRKLLSELENKYPIVIDAYISGDLPEQYAKTRSDLLSMLKEFRALASSDIRVNIHDNLARASDEARNAAAQYRIQPRTVQVSAKGTVRPEQVILGVGFRCGPEQVSVPFLDFGVPVEYELVRSLVTVAKGDRKTRKKIGVVATDAQVMGGVSMNFMQPQQNQAQLIIEELRKQYSVDEVDLTQPLEMDKFDVLVAVQPSTLGPQQMANLVEAVKSGVPTAIFEDPFPGFMSNVGGTGEPRRGSGFSQPQPAGDIRTLWKVLGIKGQGSGAGFAGGPVAVDLIWQEYNPYVKFAMAGMGPEYTFVHRNQPTSRSGKPPFNVDEPVVRTLEEVLFVGAGGITRDDDVEGITFTDLLNTGDLLAGRCGINEYRSASMSQQPDAVRRALGEPTGKSYVVAARIRGAESSTKASADATKEETKSDDKAKSAADSDDKTKATDGEDSDAKSRPINVIYVADIDVLSSVFVELRARPQNELFGDLRFNFDNIPFVLNVIDDLAGVDRFLEIRTRKFRHSTLQAVENRTNGIRKEMMDEVKNFQQQITKKEQEEDAAVQEVERKFEEREQEILTKQPVDYVALNSLRQQRALEIESRRRKADVAKLEFRNNTLTQIENLQLDHERDVQRIQNGFKAWALALPPIPPLLLGVIVFARRRLLEREGIAKTRLR